MKTNIAEVWEATLRAPNGNGDIINIGGICDSYQPAERHYKQMPEILKLKVGYKNPIIISTKSDSILRDIDLIEELARHTYVHIITTRRNVVSKMVEPDASSPADRYKALCARKQKHILVFTYCRSYRFGQMMSKH